MRVVISNSDNKGKRLQAIFYDGDKKVMTTSSGLQGGSTFGAYFLC